MKNLKNKEGGGGGKVGNVEKNDVNKCVIKFMYVN